MKRVTLIVMSLIMSTVYSVAQEHMSFLGISIEGSIDDFANKLVTEKGFVIAEVNDYESQTFVMETKKLIGAFEEFEPCNVYVRLMTDSLTEISSVLVEIDTLAYPKETFDNLIEKYDERYGEHSTWDGIEWRFREGEIAMGVNGGKFYIAFLNREEVLIRSRKALEESKENLMKALMESSKQNQTVKEICGIPFGTSIEEARTILENKYGYPEYSSDKMVITYKHKSYAGIRFDTIHFLFESDGVHSFMNGCVFILNAETLREAKKKRDMLYEKLNEKYFMLSDKDENGNTYYVGGYAPIGDGCAFVINILKYEKELARLYNPYAARLMYGTYRYVKEEF